jgi:hypothetical protein
VELLASIAVLKNQIEGLDRPQDLPPPGHSLPPLEVRQCSRAMRDSLIMATMLSPLGFTAPKMLLQEYERVSCMPQEDKQDGSPSAGSKATQDTFLSHEAQDSETPSAESNTPLSAHVQDQEEPPEEAPAEQHGELEMPHQQTGPTQVNFS